MGNPGLEIDVDAFVEEVLTRAIRGLRTTLVQTEALAKKHAPVRSIFKSSRTTKEVPRLNVNNAGPYARRKITTIAGRTAMAYGPTPKKALTAYRRHPIRSQAGYDAAMDAIPRNRRMYVPKSPPTVGIATDKYGVPLGDLRKSAETERIIQSIPVRGMTYGHNNSYQPVFRRNGAMATGDFRQWRGGKLLPVAAVVRYQSGKTKFVEPAQVQKMLFNPEKGKLNMLSGRGAYEVRTGRAKFRATAEDPYRIGGALRASIHVVPPVVSGRSNIVGLVRAGGESGGQIVDYAGFQEFGTRHNRAHPFLRPALYESRELFKKNVRNALGGEVE